jgi:hypothetical protein
VDRRRFRARALVAVTALVLGISTQALLSSPAQAAPPAPAGLTSTGGPIPTLSWTRVPGATRYAVQGSDNSSFAAPVFSIETVNTSYVPTRVLKEGTLYWRVQAKDNEGSSDFTNAQTTIGTYPAPTGITVTGAAGGAILPPVSAPLISWDSVAGATSYDVEVDNEGDGVGGTVRDGIATSTYVWPDPQGVGERVGTEDFYVRVRAHFENSMQTAWSPYVRYDVNQLPEVTSAACAPEAVCAPAPGQAPRASKSVQDVVFDWDPVKGAKSYEIWVALDRDFNNQVERRNIQGTRYSPSDTYDNNNYYWKVRAINAADQPAPWPTEPNMFQRRWPDQPTLVWPPVTSLQTVGDDFYYQWSPVRHASRYQLDVGTDPNFTPGSYQTCTTANTTLTDPNCVPQQGQVYYWRVRALDGPRGVQGIFSDTDPSTPGNQPGRFVYDSGVVTRVSPAPGATVDIPTFRWQPATDAATYTIQVFDLSDNLVSQETTSALSWTPEQNDLTPLNGTFKWTIYATDGNGHQSPIPPTQTFTLSGVTNPPVGTPLAPLPQTPESVTWRFPQLRWEPMTGASWYRVEVSETPGFWLPQGTTGLLSRRNAYPTVTDDSNYFLRPGTYTWRVHAYNSGDVEVGVGTMSTFTVTGPPAATGQRVALNGRDLDAGLACDNAIADGDQPCDGIPATPVLDWPSIPGMGAYMVYVAEDPDLTNLVTSATVHSSRWMPTFPLADNQSGQAYYWFIRPCVAVNINCAPDPVSQTDSATNAFRKVSPKVELTSPAAGSVETGTEVTFSWEDYAQTNQGVAGNPSEPGAYFAGGAYPSSQTARSYRLQVGTSATINDNNALEDVSVDQTTYTAPSRIYPEGDLWWRVQAIDENGNRLAWSDTRKVTKASPTNNLFLDQNETAGSLDPVAFPISGAGGPRHVPSGSVAFRWSAQNFDATWLIEVYKNDDTTLSNANRVISAYVHQAAFVPSSALPPSSEAYRWRVRRYDASGADASGRWSDLGRFFVDNQPVGVTGPADGGTQPPNGPVLTWSPYAVGSGQATRYSVDIRNANGDSWDSTGSTYATAYAPSALFPTGAYTWQVTAYDPVGNVMGTSPRRSFTVAGGLSATTATQIQAPQGLGVGRTLTSTSPTWNQPNVATTYQWLRDGNAIGGANGTSYVTTAADQDKSITLQATGRLYGYTDGTSTSNALVVQAGASPTPSRAPSITGKPEPRETLMADPGDWAGTGGSSVDFTYQWFVGDQAVAKETGRGYVVRTRDAGQPIKVRVTASAPGYVNGEAFSAPVSVAKLQSKTAATMTVTKITQRQRAVIDVYVEMIGFDTALGSVKVTDGGKVLSTTALKTDGDGHVTIRLKKLTAGKHKLLVSYTGSTATSPSQAKPVVVKVLKAKK